MKYAVQCKKTIFLLIAFLSITTFTGCGETSTIDDIKDDATSQIEEIQEITEESLVNELSEDTVVQKGWYVKLAVQSEMLKDESTVFGYFEGASDGKDRFESEALSSTGLYTTIYHEDFGTIKHYRSDYRAYKEIGEKPDVWIIKVNSGDRNANVTLSWKGITYVTKTFKNGFREELRTDSSELSLMRLVDVETGDVMSVTDEDMKITFNMNGSRERTFQWLLLAEGEPEPDIRPLEKTFKPTAKNMKAQTSEEEEEANDGFAPPSFEKR